MQQTSAPAATTQVEGRRPCSGCYQSGQPCKVKNAKYTKCGQPYCGTHLPFEDCYVCLDACNHKQQSTLLTCGHRFHTACIGPWLTQHDTCPVCRARVSNALLNKFWDASAGTSDAEDEFEGTMANIVLFADDQPSAGLLFPQADRPAVATLVLDFMGDPSDITTTDLESIILQMLDRATVRVRSSTDNRPPTVPTASMTVHRSPSIQPE